MHAVADTIVVLFGLLLPIVTAVVFVNPALAERCFAAFASSARAHYTEQGVRLLVGAALVVAAPTMWQSALFRLIGWAIVLSSVALVLLPWRWHQRFGERIRPAFIRHMKWYAVGVFVFGVLLLFGILAAGKNIAA